MSENPQKPPKRLSTPAVILLVIVAAGALYFGWRYLSGSLEHQVQDELGPRISWLEVDKEKESLPQDEEPAPAGEQKIAAIRMTPGEESPALEPPDECMQTAEKIALFFEHLDRQKYIMDYAFKGSSQDHMKKIVDKLLDNPPVVTGETDDLFAILNNMAHFFKILGPRDTLLIKDILIHERELVEPTMALFYRWSELETECSESGLDLSFPLKGLYLYAGYFINTLGGQSYLFRRAPYLRLLIRYYSILIIDRANSFDANIYGIDIRYTLDSLISEIESNRDLADREKYLETLIRLEESYHARYGSG